MSGLSRVHRPMPRNLGVAQRRVFRRSRGHTLAPHLEGAAFHLATHQRNHGRFVQAKLRLDRLEWCAIFPRHFNDAGDVGGGKVSAQKCGFNNDFVPSDLHGGFSADLTDTFL